MIVVTSSVRIHPSQQKVTCKRHCQLQVIYMYVAYDNKFQKFDVTCSWSPLPLSKTVTPQTLSLPFERDVLHGRPLYKRVYCSRCTFIGAIVSQ